MGKYGDYDEQSTLDNSDKIALQDGASGQTKYATVAKMAAKAIASVSAGDSYTNGGSAGGTFYKETIGAKKVLRGKTGAISIGAASGFALTDRTITLPAGFFSTIRCIKLTVTEVANTEYLMAQVALVSGTSSINVRLIQLNGASGQAAIYVEIEGT